MAWLRNATLILLAAAALMGAAAIDRRPSVFTDTIFYYAQGEALAALTGLDRSRDPAGVADPSSVVENDRRPAPSELDTYIGARSPAYGLLLFGAVRIGTLWLLVAIQSLIAAVVLFIVSRALAPARPGIAFVASTAVAAVGTALPFLTAFAMPDLFAGLAALSAIALLALDERLGLASKGTLWVVLAFALTCHDAFAPVVLAILAAGAGLAWRRSGPRAAVGRAAPVTAALLVAALAGWAWTAGHAAVTGHLQHKPPFLTARVLADGPGRAYLRDACAREPGRYILCRFQDRDLADSETFLWADDPARGVFTPADVATRLAIERQEPDFVLHAVAADPIGEVEAAVANTGRQLVAVYVDDPLINPAAFSFSRFFHRTRVADILPDGAACRADMIGCATPLAPFFGPLKTIHQSLALIALAFVAWRLARRAPNDPPRSDLEAVAALILVAVVANAAICGAVSGPFARYGARMVWLVPWLAATVAVRLDLRPSRRALAATTVAA